MPNESRSPTNLPRLRAVTERWLRPAADGVVAVVLAPACAACGAPLEQPTRGAVCPACWEALVPITALGSTPLPPHITRSTAIGPYEGRLRDVIHALKYDPRPTIARQLAARMAAAGADILKGADVVVPVPLHGTRERARGFNQARALAMRLGLPLSDALIRTKATAAQADLPADRRQANVRGAFALNRRAAISGRVVVLVDDVTTTGATLNACAAVLVDAGAADVRALTAARATLKAAATSR